MAPASASSPTSIPPRYSPQDSHQWQFDNQHHNTSPPTTQPVSSSPPLNPCRQSSPVPGSSHSGSPASAPLHNNFYDHSQEWNFPDNTTTTNPPPTLLPSSPPSHQPYSQDWQYDNTNTHPPTALPVDFPPSLQPHSQDWQYESINSPHLPPTLPLSPSPPPPQDWQYDNSNLPLSSSPPAQSRLHAFSRSSSTHSSPGSQRQQQLDQHFVLQGRSIAKSVCGSSSGRGSGSQGSSLLDWSPSEDVLGSSVEALAEMRGYFPGMPDEELSCTLDAMQGDVFQVGDP